jgi:hypothetical protein
MSTGKKICATILLNLIIGFFTRVFFALAFCAASVGQTSAYMQDYTKAKNAANVMFDLIEQKPEIDVAAAPGSRPVSQNNKLFA